MSLNWYAVKTLPVARIEFDVGSHLNQNEYMALVPFEVKHVKKSGRTQTKQKKFVLYPRYVFAAFDGYDDFRQARGKINDWFESRGKRPPILGLVGAAGAPSKLSEADLAFIKSASVPRATLTNIHKAFQKGGAVNILEGPFAGLTAKVDNVSRKKIGVMLRIFNSMQVVDMAPSALEAA